MSASPITRQYPWQWASRSIRRNSSATIYNAAAARLSRSMSPELAASPPGSRWRTSPKALTRRWRRIFSWNCTCRSPARYRMAAGSNIFLSCRGFVLRSPKWWRGVSRHHHLPELASTGIGPRSNNIARIATNRNISAKHVQGNRLPASVQGQIKDEVHRPIFGGQHFVRETLERVVSLGNALCCADNETNRRVLSTPARDRGLSYSLRLLLWSDRGLIFASRQLRGPAHLVRGCKAE